MASERQIVANRQNGRRSRGPKSSAGKRHSSANAVRHGLSRKIGARGDPETEALAHLLVAENADEERLEHARNVVRAHRDLLHIREVKRDLMEHLYWFGAPGPLRRFRSRSAEIRYLTSLPIDRPLQWPQRLDPAATLPLDRDERAAETVRRLLPDLRQLNRYERRAFKAKQDALRKLAELVKF
jgi:hypothetical protein